MIRKPKLKNLREKQGRKPGGQKGHKGITLELSSNPDKIIRHTLENCAYCGNNLKEEETEKVERRQVYEIPEIKVNIEEHQSEKKKCRSCGKTNKSKFPEGINNVVQYGLRLKSYIVYLMNAQLLPYQRTQEIFEDLFGHKLSQGTLNNTNSSCYELLEETEEKIKESLSKTDIIHLDESGLYVNKKRQWLHVVGTQRLTYYKHHAKRGREAIDSIGILPLYQGRAIHDFWKSYMLYDCQHGLCNVHHLRELKFIAEEQKQLWAKKMIELLLEIKQEREKRIENREESLREIEIREYEKKYHQIIEEGIQLEKPQEEVFKKKKRGRKKQSKAKNLLDRFINYEKEVLGYMYDFQVPFDNNQAERDIRMIKLQQKISGCFRSDRGAEYFCRIRGYISTAKKQGVNVLEAIESVFDRNPFQLYRTE